MMDIFNIIAGIASIISFGITIATLNKVSHIEKNIDNSVASEQKIEAENISDTELNQSGRDINKK